MGSYGKTRIFRPKIEFSGPKKHPLLNSDHVRATTVVQTKKYPFPKQISVFWQILGVIGLFGIFDPMPDKKMQTRCIGGSSLCGYQNLNLFPYKLEILGP